MKRVILERQKLGWSQAKLAREVGTNQSCMSRIERGLEQPYRLRAQRIADALHWKGDPMELFEEVAEDGEPAPTPVKAKKKTADSPDSIKELISKTADDDALHRALVVAADSQETFERAIKDYRKNEFESPLEAGRFHEMLVAPHATKACAQAELIGDMFGLSDKEVHELIQDIIAERNAPVNREEKAAR